MSAASMPQRSPLAVPFGISMVLHIGIVVAALVVKPAPPPSMPPMIRVDMVAAPAGERAIGAVDPVREAPAETPPPARAEQKAAAPIPSRTTAPPPRTATRATATAPRTAQRSDRAAEQVRAGGGATGGDGTDVVTMKTEGIEFPFPAYRTNIINQVYARFKAPVNSSLSADVAFLIHRDGRVTDARLVKRSGSYTFDLEAMGAIEAAARSFGPLPDGYSDDVLPVVFSFDPKLIR